jgi:hypothetical protein
MIPVHPVYVGPGRSLSQGFVFFFSMRIVAARGRDTGQQSWLPENSNADPAGLHDALQAKAEKTEE